MSRSIKKKYFLSHACCQSEKKDKKIWHKVFRKKEKQKIGSRIDERMTELNLSNVAVAAHVGISKVAVGKWRKGDTEPTGSNLTKLVQILKQRVFKEKTSTNQQ